MKKLLALLVVIVMTLTLFGACAPQAPAASSAAPAASSAAPAASSEAPTASSAAPASEAPAKKIKIGAATQTLQIECYQFMKAAAEGWFAENAPEVEFVWQACDYDPVKQTSQVETYIAQKYDALIIEPVMPQTGDTLVKMCKAANIPVVISETKPATELVDYYLVADSFKVGEGEVEFFIKQWGTEKPAKAVIMSGTKGDYVAEEITRGYLETLKKYPNIEVVMHQWCKDWDPTTALGHMENALAQNNNKLDVIFANNDQMINGCIKAAKNAGVEKNMWFVAGDFDKETVQHFWDGLNIGIMDKGQKDCGKDLAAAAYATVTGGKFRQDEKMADGQMVTWIPITMVTKDNIDEMAKYKFDLVKP
jgi:ABC-type sugar transport system substrate-binding protein